MTKRYYIDKKDVKAFVKQITLQQMQTGEFYNVSIKPYTGEKYDKENTVVVVVG
jgi:hypothetical protein